jgi:hypothetical protein
VRHENAFLCQNRTAEIFMEGNNQDTSTYSEIQRFIDERLDKIERVSPAQPSWKRCMGRLIHSFRRLRERCRKDCDI